MAAPFVWDPDRVLQITDLGRNEVICIGRAARRFNSRCTWSIKEPERSEASSLLRSMARKPPTEVRKEELWELAGLCLCHQAHQDQQGEAFMELQNRLHYARDDYERFRTLQKQNIELRNEIQNEKTSALSALIKVNTAMLENSTLRDRETSLCLKVNEQARALSKTQETERGLKTQLANMSQRLDQQTTTIVELQGSESGLRRMSDHLEQLLQKEKLTVEGLESSRTGLEGQLTELCRQLSSQKGAVDELEASRSDLQGQLTELYQQLSSQKGVVDELEASRSDLQGQLHELRQRLNKQNTAVEHLETENRTLKDQHTTTVAELGTSQLKTEQMESELQSVQTSKVDLQRQLDEAIVLLNNTWQTRLRNWLQAYRLSFMEAFRRVCHGLAIPSNMLERVLSIKRFFRGQGPVAGQYSEV